jgi:hypothetical protein
MQSDRGVALASGAAPIPIGVESVELEEPAVKLDMIIVLILASLFFGGTVFLVWIERKKEKLRIVKAVIPAAEIDPRKEEMEPRRRRAG